MRSPYELKLSFVDTTLLADEPSLTTQ